MDAYSRLVAMKLVALRAADYMRSASADDRRYLLYNPVVKMKVTTQGEDVVNHLWDVIAAKGFERDMYFEMAARDVRALPKLEGTVHVNIALIVKFMPNYFFNPAEYADVPQRSDAKNDDFLFDQGPTKGLGKIRFHDWKGSSWAVLFSHPKDFTPVCTTELGYLAKLKPEFEKRGCKVLGLSVDPVDDCTMVFTTEYIPSNGSFNWATTIQSVKLTS